MGIKKHRPNQCWASSIAVGFALFLPALGSAHAIDTASKTNVIVILADDLCIGDLGSIDDKSTRTPNLDRLADQSVRFSRAYSASCVCAPARAALLTGRYPHRTGVVTLNQNKFPKLTQLRRDEVTLADAFKSAGYATGMIGKWHTGRGDGFHPLDRGFDEFQGFDGSDDVGYFRYPFTYQRQTKITTDKYLTEELTKQSVQFVRRHRDHPFFLHLAHYAPHRPLEAPPKTIRKYEDQGFDRSTATIYAMIEIMDHGIGQLLDELDTLGLSDHTIVLFASDNGPDPLTGKRHNADLRGTKYQVYEGGIRVPMFVRWPNQLKPGTRQQAVHFVDVLPTLLELAGVGLPNNDGYPTNALDGESFANVLRDASSKFSPTRFWQWNRGSPNYTHNAAIRKGKYKLIRPFVTRGIKTTDSFIPEVLYDLEADPSESQDIVQSHPAIAQTLSGELKRWTTSVERDRVRPAPPAKQPNVVFILADDLGWSDLGCYGHAYHRTPNLDRLASNGLRFTNGYAPAPICSASRASILTGKTVARLGFEFVTKNEPGHQQIDTKVPLRTPKFNLNLPTAETTIAERMADLNYRTAFFGKWHVSQHYQKQYLAWHPRFGPKQQGFQFAEQDFGDHPYAWKKKKPHDLPKGEFPRDSMIERTARFIRAQADSRQPFFVMASSFYVHTPVKNRCRWLIRKYEQHLSKNVINRQKRLEYAAFVETLDHHVGTILKAVDDSGQCDNTLVFFMSDNGGHPEYCANAPLRGSKWNLYEGGVRVPMIACWPDGIPAGTTSDTPVIGYDLLPTFVDVASGESLRHLSEIDGISIRNAFTDPSWQPERSLIWHFPYYHPEKTYSKAIEKIGVDDFATSKTRPQSAIRRGQHKLIQFAENDRVELYHLSDDISEQVDLSATQPNLATELRTLLEQQLDSVNARRAIPQK